MGSQETTVITTLGLDGSSLPRKAISLVRWGLGIAGASSLILGLLITFWPERTAMVLAIFFGVHFLIAGVGYVVVSFLGRSASTGARVLSFVLGALFAGAGVVIMANPADSARVLGIFIGVYVGLLWLIEGIVTLIQIKDAPSRVWGLFFGVISVLAGIALLTSPMWGAALLFMIAGIVMIPMGIIQLVRAFTFGRRARG
ncbi:MAG: DUF308 domain-containing protein [Nigerium sp.]|nr:DUF308 domain-containing protein [Nigerium sp.]